MSLTPRDREQVRRAHNSCRTLLQAADNWAHSLWRPDDAPETRERAERFCRISLDLHYARKDFRKVQHFFAQAIHGIAVLPGDPNLCGKSCHELTLAFIERVLRDGLLLQFQDKPDAALIARFFAILGGAIQNGVPWSDVDIQELAGLFQYSDVSTRFFAILGDAVPNDVPSSDVAIRELNGLFQSSAVPMPRQIQGVVHELVQWRYLAIGLEKEIDILDPGPAASLSDQADTAIPDETTSSSDDQSVPDRLIEVDGALKRVYIDGDVFARGGDLPEILFKICDAALGPNPVVAVDGNKLMKALRIPTRNHPDGFSWLADLIRNSRQDGYFLKLDESVTLRPR